MSVGLALAKLRHFVWCGSGRRMCGGHDFTQRGERMVLIPSVTWEVFPPVMLDM